MQRRMTIGLALLLAFLVTIPVRAEAPAAAEARLVKDLTYLTSDECEGRGITTKGINLAADYIARQFQQAGLRPGGPDGTYFQPFALTTGGRVGNNPQLVLTGPQGQTITLDPQRHFAVSLQGSSGQVTGPLVFAGYGITSTEPKYDDYAGLDVSGKVVVLLTGTPRRGHRYADVFAAAADGRGSPHASLTTKLENAAKHRAAAVLVVNDQSALRFGDRLPRPVASLRSGEPARFPVVHVRRDVIDRVLLSTAGKDLLEIEKGIDAALQPSSLALTGWACRVQTEVSHTKLTVKNVIGVLDGRGPLARETVVIGAHYDHVGMGSSNRFGAFRTGVAGPGAPGGVGFPLAEMAVTAIHRGADDNASGSTALMELARRFGAAQNATASNGNGAERSERRLVFIAFTAEESGLIGSAHYCRQPVFPLADTVAMLNMDMVGRLQDNKLMIGGLGSAKPFAALIDRLNEKHRFDLLREMSGQGPSDHASFYAQKVPVFKFFTGFHEQYHRPGDRPETIDVAGLGRIVGLVGDVAAEVRASPARPEYVKTGGFDRTRTLWSTAPATGVLPDYSDKKEGVLIEGVIKDTPAAKAGLKKGDRIVALAGKPLKDAAAFHAASRALKPGEKVEAAIERDGKPQKVEIQLVRAPAGTPTPRFGWIADMTDLKDGLLLVEVPAESAAGKAGLKKGDRVVAIAGEAIVDRAALFELVRGLEAGEKVVVTAMRGGKQQSFEVVTAEQERGRGTPGGRFGAVPDFRNREDGVLLSGVQENSPAAAAGLKAGDRIVAINGKPVKDLREYGEAVRGLAEGAKVEVTFRRDGKEQKVQVEMK
jgi:S1-C subfamily serine protease